MSRYAVQVQGRDDADRSGEWVTLAEYPRNEPGLFTAMGWPRDGDNAAFAAFKAREYYGRPVRVVDLEETEARAA